MFDDADSILRTGKGTLVERPLPQLFQAIHATRRTCGLELKRAGLEKTIFFFSGVPVGCASNLVNETLGRFLVDRELITGQQYMQVLNESARRQANFESVLLEKGLIDEPKLEKQVQANLAQKLLECFRQTDARYRILGDVDIVCENEHLNAPQLLLTAALTVMSAEQIRAQFPVEPQSRFACVHQPPVRPEDLKLSPAEAQLLEAVGERCSVEELAARFENDALAVQRRLYALALLGLVDSADRVPIAPPEPPPPDPTWRPEPSAVFAARSAGRRWPWAIAAVVLVLAGAGAAVALYERGILGSPPQPAAPVAAVPAQPKRLRAAPPSATARESDAMAVAPEGARARPDQPRGLALSASAIRLAVPEAAKGAAKKRDSALLARGAALLNDGQAEAAAVIFQKLIKNDAASAPAAYGLALAMYESDKDEEARVRVARALEIDGEYAPAHLLAGFLEQQAGRVEPAKQHYRAWLEASAEDPAAEDVRAILEQLR